MKAPLEFTIEREPLRVSTRAAWVSPMGEDTVAIGTRVIVRKGQFAGFRGRVVEIRPDSQADETLTMTIVTVEEVYDVTERGLLDAMRRHAEHLMSEAHRRRGEPENNERVAKYLADQSKLFADAADTLQVKLEQNGRVHSYQF